MQLHYKNLLGCCLFYSGDNSSLGPRNTHACRMVDSSSSSVKAVFRCDPQNRSKHEAAYVYDRMKKDALRVKLDEPGREQSLSMICELIWHVVIVLRSVINVSCVG